MRKGNCEFVEAGREGEGLLPQHTLMHVACLWGHLWGTLSEGPALVPNGLVVRALLLDGIEIILRLAIHLSMPGRARQPTTLCQDGQLIKGHSVFFL